MTINLPQSSIEQQIYWHYQYYHNLGIICLCFYNYYIIIIINYYLRVWLNSKFTDIINIITVLYILFMLLIMINSKLLLPQSSIEQQIYWHYQYYHSLGIKCLIKINYYYLRVRLNSKFTDIINIITVLVITRVKRGIGITTIDNALKKKN